VLLSYKDIPGWFDFEDLYKYVVERSRDGSKFIEVGCCFGKSTAFLAEQIKIKKISGESIWLGAVDIWTSDSQFYQFKKNMFELDLHRYVQPIRAPSGLAALMFQDQSIDFIMIDADHKHDSVVADFNSWAPKVKPGGILAFHDIHLLTVREALDRVVGVDIGEIWGKTWVYTAAPSGRINDYRPND
jgi:predicted O-methyltransferase YrrM